jgi:hypothetical protein
MTAPRRGRPGAVPPAALIHGRLTPGDRLVAYALWSHSRPGDRPGLRICDWSIGDVANGTGLPTRSAHEHVRHLVDAGWVVRGKLPKPRQGRAQRVLVLLSSPLSPLQAQEQERQGLMVVDFGRAQVHDGRSPWDLPDGGAHARARARRRDQESRITQANVIRASDENPHSRKSRK